MYFSFIGGFLKIYPIIDFGHIHFFFCFFSAMTSSGCFVFLGGGGCSLWSKLLFTGCQVHSHLVEAELYPPSGFTFRYLMRSAGLPSDVVLISWQCWKNFCRWGSWGGRKNKIFTILPIPADSPHWAVSVLRGVPEDKWWTLRASSLWTASLRFPPTWYLAETEQSRQNFSIYWPTKGLVQRVKPLKTCCCSTFLLSWQR